MVSWLAQAKPLMKCVKKEEASFEFLSTLELILLLVSTELSNNILKCCSSKELHSSLGQAV